MAAYIYDLLLGKKNVDEKWEGELAKAAEAVAKDRERRRNAEAATTAARKDAAHPIDSYVAVYHYDRLGDITVTREGGRLYAQLGTHRAEIIPTGGDGFLVDWIGEGDSAPVKFVFETGDRPARIDWGGRLFDRVP